MTGHELSPLVLPQIAAEALDACAGFLERARCRGVGEAERRADAERRALHHRDAFGFQKLGDEILVSGELVAGRRSLSHGPGAGRIAARRAVRVRALVGPSL